MKSANQPIGYTRVTPDQWTAVDADVIVETPVSLTVNGEVWLTFMCTPVDLEEMAVGFLYNEGMIAGIEEIADVRLCAAGDNVDVWLNHSAEKPVNWRRTSGCTGGYTAVTDAVGEPLEDAVDDALESAVDYAMNKTGGVIHAPNGSVVNDTTINDLVSQLFEAQRIYKETGGVHTSGLSDGRSILLACEDIGRHNTLDKIAGRMLLEKIDPPQKIILSTGRISSEMLQKAARMGASIVISRTSPSSLSIELAERLSVTLIGYARRNRFNIYTHPERIAPARQLEREHVRDAPGGMD